jgi:peptidyl-prolyl cis-trans isomerase D
MASISPMSAASPCIFQLPTTSFLRAIPRFLPFVASAVAAPRLKVQALARKAAGNLHFPKDPKRMLSSFRRLSKSKFGTGIIVFVGVLILIGFAWGDISSLSIGSGGLSADTLAKSGSLEVTDRDISSAMQRRLGQVREQDPEATYSSIAADFDPLLQSLIDQNALQAFARKHGFILSKRLVDAEIANLPGVRGLNGQVSTTNYQAFLSRERLTDAEVRNLIAGTLLQRLMITPAATSARVPVGVATPYASMLLEQRQGQIALVPLSLFAAGLKPTDAQIQQYYSANRARYMVPEQRVLKIAPIGPAQVANVTATPQEIQAYYNAHQDVYGAKDIRTISQAVVPDQKVAAAIAERARSGQSFVEAAKPAGLGPADVAVGEQTRAQFSDNFGDKVAAAAWAAQPGDVIGPIQSPLGWHVIKIEGAKTQAGKSLAEARGEISEKVTSDKRENALADLVNKIEDSLDGGSSFDEAARKANLEVTTTPLITASGEQRGNPSYKFPADLAPALKSGFEIAPTDEPVVEQLADDKGFALVAPTQVVPAAPAPLSTIRDEVKADWIHQQAMNQAQAFAKAISSKASGKTSLADAAKEAGKPLPPVQQVSLRRIQLSQMGDKVPEPLRVLFSTAAGKAQIGSDPQGRGFFIVKVDKIVPGNALNNPGLITEVQNEFRDPLAQEYAKELIAAIRTSIGVRRNESAIAATKKRITTPGG